jgi:hypothetical protein
VQRLVEHLRPSQLHCWLTGEALEIGCRAPPMYDQATLHQYLRSPLSSTKAAGTQHGPRKARTEEQRTSTCLVIAKCYWHNVCKVANLHLCSHSGQPQVFEVITPGQLLPGCERRCFTCTTTVSDISSHHNCDWISQLIGWHIDPVWLCATSSDCSKLTAIQRPFENWNSSRRVVLLYQKAHIVAETGPVQSVGVCSGLVTPLLMMTAAGGNAAMDSADHKADGVLEYWRFLAGNRPYRLLAIGEVWVGGCRWQSCAAICCIIAPHSHVVDLAQQNGRVHTSCPLQVINSLGGWANFVATLNLVELLGGGSAVLVSFAVVIRVLPSLLMFPAAGVVADRRAVLARGSLFRLQPALTQCM